MKRLLIGLVAAIGLLTMGGRASAQTLAVGAADCAEQVAAAPLYPGAPAGPFGIAVKRPVFGGACKVCPWGAVAEIVRDAMKPYGWFRDPKCFKDRTRSVLRELKQYFAAE